MSLQIGHLGVSRVTAAQIARAVSVIPFQRSLHITRLQFVLLCVFAGLQVADIATTNVALGHSGVWEGNPLMAFFQADLGSLWWTPKLILIGFAFLAVPLIRWRWPIISVVAFYAILVTNNLLWIYGAGA